MGWVQEGGVGGDSGRTEDNEETGKRDVGEGSIQENEGELYGPTFPPLISLYTIGTAHDGSENLLSHGRVCRNNGRKKKRHRQFPVPTGVQHGTTALNNKSPLRDSRKSLNFAFNIIIFRLFNL